VAVLKDVLHKDLIPPLIKKEAVLKDVLHKDLIPPLIKIRQY